MKRISILALAALCLAGAAYASNYAIITTRPVANVVINSTVTGKLVTTRGHLGSIESSTVNGVTTFTVTVTP